MSDFNHVMEARRLYPEVMWSGSESSLDIAIAAQKFVMEQMTARIGNTDQVDDPEVPHLFSMDGDVGVIRIRGSLVNEDSPYMRYYSGVTSYADIRRALVHAASKAEVKAVLLDVISGGGAVSGLMDTGNLIAQVAQLKPVYAYTDGMMASAAYGLGVSAGNSNVHASTTAVVGSVGVLAVVKEYSQAYKEAGIGVKVLRAGKYKALANSYEPLSKAGEDQVQAQLDAAYAVFIGHVADMRGTTATVADEKMGQGREFFGQAAVEAGLVDSITTYDDLMASIKSKLLDSQARSLNNLTYPQKGNHMTRAALTEQQRAIVAAGGSVPGLNLEAPSAEALAAEKAAADKLAADKATADAAAAAAAAAPAANADVVAYLQGQLGTANTALLDAQVKLAGATEKLTALEATQAPLIKIVAQSLSNMRVAMNMAAVDLSAMSATALLAEHASTEVTFKKALPVGGVAAVSTSVVTDSESKVDDAEYMARVKATQLN